MTLRKRCHGTVRHRPRHTGTLRSVTVERSAKSEWESSWRRRRGDETARRSRAGRPRMRHSTAWRGLALIPFHHDDQANEVAGLDSVPARTARLTSAKEARYRIEIRALSPFARSGLLAIAPVVNHLGPRSPLAADPRCMDTPRGFALRQRCRSVRTSPSSPM